MFELNNISKKSNARQGVLKTSHGRIETPFFMPVSTKGSAKHLNQKQLLELGTEAIICNALLLYFRPGLQVIKKFGGLHEFINWQKIIFTDSGGFQVLDEQFLLHVSKKGALFRSPFDGTKHIFTPEEAIRIQNSLNSDVAMCLDDVPLFGANKKRIADSAKRTIEWAKRCKKEHKNSSQLLFGISQGGLNRQLRKKCISELLELEFDGMALGGLCIGEPTKQMRQIIKYSNSLIPKNIPRYLMGVGSPKELLEAISLGVDIFDSCFPTRMARHGEIFTSQGILKIKNKNLSNSTNPIDKECNCFVCSDLSLSYLHHLFKAKEPNAMHYLSYHNLYFVQNLMKEAREAIKENSFEKFKREFEKQYKEK